MKALLIDDHPLILSALAAVIARSHPDWQVIGVETAAEGSALLDSRPDIDLVLLDLFLGDADGFELLAELRRTHPALPVVVVSASEQPQDVMRAVGAGAMGYVPKRASNELLAEALHLVMSGGVYVPPMAEFTEPGSDPVGLSDLSSSAALTAPSPDDGQGLRPGEEGAPGEPSGAVVGHASLDTLGLTARQRQVLDLLLQGKPNKAIAVELGVSVETVKDHVAAVLRCLGVTSRTQAVLAVAQIDGGRSSSLLRH